TRLQNRLEPWIADEKECSEPVTPDHHSLMACGDHLKVKPLRGGPAGRP
ncbi:hypothetical protein ABIC09_004322, partial [Bradyrhizobium sp. S3.12.5]